MPNIKPTKQSLMLASALKQKGVDIELEHWDGHKHVDIFVPKAKLYIEIDGPQHYTDAKQFSADLVRDHYSDDANFHTKHIPNQLIETNVEDIANAIFLITQKV